MNIYAVIFILLLIGVGAYLFMTNNHDQIAGAMNFGTTPSTSTASPAPGGSSPEANPYDGSTTGQNMPPTNLATNGSNGVVIPPNIAKTDAAGDNSSAIDAAAIAAASSSSNIGTVKTLTGRTYTNCKVLKIEDDGVTLNCDDGIVKLLYQVLPADLQKKFGYDPQKAVQTTAQPAQ